MPVCFNTPRFSRSKYADASTTSGEISTTSRRRISLDARTASAVTPLPRPMTSASRGSGWSSTGSRPRSRWVSMSPALDASTLPSMASARAPATWRTDTVPAAPSL